ncbi:MAG TPA: hypothetical protein VFS93_08690 [Terrimesophilobacter sp.]|nr:hypothetical protein [Terrimesophilobacter sp.]
MTQDGMLLSEGIRSSNRRSLLATMIAVGGFLTPFATFLFFRLAYNGVVAIYVLWLPWPEPWPLVVRIVSAAFIIAVWALIIRGFIEGDGPRIASAVVIAYFIASLLPLFLAYFITSYGDPGPV